MLIRKYGSQIHYQNCDLQMQTHELFYSQQLPDNIYIRTMIFLNYCKWLRGKFAKFAVYFQLYVPIIINLTLLELYIMLGAVLFSYWEGWDLTSASYFTFITLSTVGYGDMVPGNAILVSEDDSSGTITMFICISYIVLGELFLYLFFIIF